MINYHLLFDRMYSFLATAWLMRDITLRLVFIRFVWQEPLSLQKCHLNDL